MEKKPKRRWPTCRIRTLLVAVSIFCVWLWWEVSIVRERNKVRALLRQHEAVVATNHNPCIKSESSGLIIYAACEPPAIPWLWTAMGDERVRCIVVKNLSSDEQARVAKAFPEATLLRSGSPGGRPRHDRRSALHGALDPARSDLSNWPAAGDDVAR